ncbi:MAG: DUF4434 domain-containing protein [Oscillospiraceae bacterium]
MKRKPMKKLIALILSLVMLATMFTVNFAVVAQETAIENDVNGDGKFNTLDALIVLKHVAKIEILTDAQLKIADFNKDGKINTLDSLGMLKKIVGIEEPNYVTDPLVTGDFIQPWYYQEFSEEKWDSHMDMLLSAGIDTLILQGTVQRSDNDLFEYSMYPSNYIESLPSSTKESGYYSADQAVEMALKAAKKKGVKIFIGLNDSGSWWDENKQKNPQWIKKDVELAGTVAKEIYDLYYDEYKESFAGWYFVHEMYTQKNNLEDSWISILNQTIEKLNEIDKSIPLCLSPFFSAYYTTAQKITPKDAGAMWDKIIKGVNFREGDIFSPQDSYGGGERTLEYLDETFSYFRKTIDEKGNMKFWINCENFTNDYGSASISRFTKQLKIAAKYADNIITFSYSHYYDPTYKNSKYDKEYKKYRKSILGE